MVRVSMTLPIRSKLGARTASPICNIIGLITAQRVILGQRNGREQIGQSVAMWLGRNMLGQEIWWRTSFMDLERDDF